eukprot:scaffold482_cov247-Pinguiococcus_pyrenoidosus.AAC.34
MRRARGLGANPLLNRVATSCAIDTNPPLPPLTHAQRARDAPVSSELDQRRLRPRQVLCALSVGPGIPKSKLSATAAALLSSCASQLFSSSAPQLRGRVASTEIHR